MILPSRSHSTIRPLISFTFAILIVILGTNIYGSEWRIKPETVVKLTTIYFEKEPYEGRCILASYFADPNARDTLIWLKKRSRTKPKAKKLTLENALQLINNKLVEISFAPKNKQVFQRHHFIKSQEYHYDGRTYFLYVFKRTDPLNRFDALIIPILDDHTVPIDFVNAAMEFDGVENNQHLPNKSK